MSADAVPTLFNPSSSGFDLFMRMVDRVREHSREYEERLLNYNRKHEQYCLDSLRQFNAASPQASKVIQPPVFPDCNLPELIEELQHMAKSDPHVPFSSELFGELHLAIRPKEYAEDQASIPVPASDPNVSYTETVSAESDSMCLSMSPNKHDRPFMKDIPKTEKDVEVAVVAEIIISTHVSCPEIVSSSSKKSNLRRDTSSPVSPKSRSAVIPNTMTRQRVQNRSRIKKRQRSQKGRAKKRQSDGLVQPRDRRGKSPLIQLPVRNSGERVKTLIGQRWAYARTIKPFVDPIQRYLVTIDRNGKCCSPNPMISAPGLSTTDMSLELPLPVCTQEDDAEELVTENLLY